MTNIAPETPTNRDGTVGALWDQVKNLKIETVIKLAGFAVTIVAAVFAAGATSAVWFNAKPKEANAAPVSGAAQTYYGYYRDINDDGSPKISDEEWQIEFAQNSPDVRASVTGPVTYKKRTIQRQWKFQGFHHGNYLAMSFVTVPSTQDPHPSGIGVYQLEQSGGTDFVGTALYLDCGTGKIIQCPYALTLQRMDETVAKARWPKLFARVCEPLTLVPDVSKLASSCLAD